MDEQVLLLYTEHFLSAIKQGIHDKYHLSWNIDNDLCVCSLNYVYANLAMH